MTKIRLAVIILTFLVVSSLGILASFYARGYRFNFKSGQFEPNGILVIKSDPGGAQVFINGELKTATDASLSLSPGTYDVEVAKDGFFSWKKRLTIKKEEVTDVSPSLFKVVASLTPVTFSGSLNPVISEDLTRIAFFLPLSETQTDRSKSGLWLIETVNLPFGFTQEPRQITAADLTDASWQFSPNGQEIMLTTATGSFLLKTSNFTAQGQWINIASQKPKILADWQKERETKLEAQMKNLPGELSNILQRKASQLVFSPDESKLVYVASGSAEIRENLIHQLPGSSTQKQERTIKEGQSYVYDIKEDRNFLISEQKLTLSCQQTGSECGQGPILRWFPNSKNLVLAEEGKISILDYDGTNHQTVYSGAYLAPQAYPFASTAKLLILTNLGSDSSVPNLYSLSIK